MGNIREGAENPRFGSWYPELDSKWAPPNYRFKCKADCRPICWRLHEGACLNERLCLWYIQGDSWVTDIRVGVDFLGLCYQKSLCQRGSFAMVMGLCVLCSSRKLTPVDLVSHLNTSVTRCRSLLSNICFCHWKAVDINIFQAYVQHFTSTLFTAKRWCALRVRGGGGFENQL